jgi:hypothetical protein
MFTPTSKGERTGVGAGLGFGLKGLWLPKANALGPEQTLRSRANGKKKRATLMTLSEP